MLKEDEDGDGDGDFLGRMENSLLWHRALLFIGPYYQPFAKRRWPPLDGGTHRASVQLISAAKATRQVLCMMIMHLNIITEPR